MQGTALKKDKKCPRHKRAIRRKKTQQNEQLVVRVGGKGEARETQSTRTPYREVERRLAEKT